MPPMMILGTRLGLTFGVLRVEEGGEGAGDEPFARVVVSMVGFRDEDEDAAADSDGDPSKETVVDRERTTRAGGGE